MLDKNKSLQITNLTIDPKLQSKYKILNNTQVIVIKTLSKDLQEFIYTQIKNGNLARYDTVSGVAINKEELENLISIADNSFLTEDILNPDNEIDVSNNFFFKSLKDCREQGISTKDFVLTKSIINRNKYVDLRQLLKPQLNKIAKILNCTVQEVLKQLEPLLKAQFVESKKKEIKKDENRN